MDYRPLGRTDIKVSAICLGTMTWGKQNTPEEAFEQMDYAVEQGINFFDAAESYPVPGSAETKGRTEQIIGDWLEARGKRDDIVLATKVAGRSDRNWLRENGEPTSLTRAQIFEAVDASLKRLKTDHVDLYQVHWPDRSVSQFGSNPVVFRKTDGPEVPIGETLDALGEVVKAGKARHIGLSNESAWGTMQYLRHADGKALPRPQSIQNAYSLVNRIFEANLAEVAMREDVGLLAYSPIAGGWLSGKYLDGALPKGSRKQLFNFMTRYDTPGAAPAIRAYMDLARDAGVDPVQMALQFVTTRPFVTSTIIGATTMEQLRHDIASVDLDLTDDLEARINDIHILHTNPCP